MLRDHKYQTVHTTINLHAIWFDTRTIHDHFHRGQLGTFGHQKTLPDHTAPFDILSQTCWYWLWHRCFLCGKVQLGTIRGGPLTTGHHSLARDMGRYLILENLQCNSQKNIKHAKQLNLRPQCLLMYLLS